MVDYMEACNVFASPARIYRTKVIPMLDEAEAYTDYARLLRSDRRRSQDLLVGAIMLTSLRLQYSILSFTGE